MVNLTLALRAGCGRGGLRLGLGQKDVTDCGQAPQRLWASLAQMLGKKQIVVFRKPSDLSSDSGWAATPWGKSVTPPL